MATFLATVNKIAVFCVLLRFCHLAVPATSGSHAITGCWRPWQSSPSWSATSGAGIQTNIKADDGYSSISRFGYLLAVVVASHPQRDAGGSSSVYLPGCTCSPAWGLRRHQHDVQPLSRQDADSLHSYRGPVPAPYLTAVMTVMMLSLTRVSP